MSGKRISREKKTIARMIALYENRCPHAIKEEGHYSALKAYADKRLDKCVFGEEKPACKQCPVHCYQPARREEMKQVMRWAGPRMLWRHPILTIRHLIDDRRPVPELPEKYRPKFRLSLSIPRRFMRESRVVRFRPSRCAAPFGPATTPLVSFSTRIMS